MQAKKISLTLAAGLVLCSVAAGVAPRKTTSVRSLDPFNPKQRVAAKQTATKRVAAVKPAAKAAPKAAAAAAAVAATPAKVRPPYRPPARSPYRPPRRGPFFP